QHDQTMRYIVQLFLCCLPLISCGQNNIPENYTLHSDVLWAEPKGYSLTMDIYSPNNEQESYPVLIIYHGGGWLINDKSIMDQMSQYIASNANYVVCNVDYRLLTANDNTTKMNEIIEDAMGAVLWVKERIAQYKGNPNQIAVTGASAGGQLAAMVVKAGQSRSDISLESDGREFAPPYRPERLPVDPLIDA